MEDGAERRPQGRQPYRVRGKSGSILSSGTPVALFALYRFGGPPV